jgi:hypothetical protein
MSKGLVDYVTGIVASLTSIGASGGVAGQQAAGAINKDMTSAASTVVGGALKPLKAVARTIKTKIIDDDFENHDKNKKKEASEGDESNEELRAKLGNRDRHDFKPKDHGSSNRSGADSKGS